jgi:hypothetical protein
MNEEELQPLKFDGLNDALIGISDVWDNSGNIHSRYIYSGPLIIDVLMRDSDMTYWDAVEFISFNIEGAYVGPSTPIVMWEPEGEEDE